MTIVVGAGRGLGRSAALTLTKESTSIVPASITNSQFNATAYKGRKLRAKALRLQTNATNEVDIEGYLQKTMRELRKIHNLVNCQGESSMRPTVETTIDNWSRC